MRGHGDVSLVPTGWQVSSNGATGGDDVRLDRHDHITAFIFSRAYFAETCKVGEYDHEKYLRLKLLGKTLRYTTDLKGAGCGCNAAFYLTSMGQNKHKSTCNDYYCDANDVCGESCAEIDIQEGGQYAWHSTLHTKHDHGGLAAGFGGGGPQWNGPRDWTSEEFAPSAKCIDTAAPFDVAVSFPVNASGFLDAMIVTLAQEGKECPISINVDKYDGNAELTEALKAGMTPIVSYWSSPDMLWLDGDGDDGRGPCALDHVTNCGESVSFYNFAVEDIRPLDVVQAKANIEAQAKRHPTTTTSATTRPTPTKPGWTFQEPVRATTTPMPWWVRQWGTSTTTMSIVDDRDKTSHVEVMLQKFTTQKHRLANAVTSTVGKGPKAAGAVVITLVVAFSLLLVAAVRRPRRAAGPQAPLQADGTSTRANRSLLTVTPSCAGLMDLGAVEQDAAV
jgi:hypothetical protein